ncbi:MAG TPA: histidine kinase [Flavobacteriaceae bacterium]|nr:histidine kinase [Flavobacteriaceae bacterium]
MIKFLRETAKAFSIGVLVFLIRGIFMLANGTTLDFNQDLALEFFYNQLFAVCLYLANAYFVSYMMSKYKQDLFKLNHLLVALLSSISISLATIFILRFLIIVYGYDQDATSFLQNEKMVFYWMSLTISVVITAIFYTVYYIKSKQDTKVKEQKVIAGTASAKFDALKNQLDPHFLFNSLNVLTSLIEENPDKAQQFTTSLSKVYRYVLEQKNKELVTVDEELKFAKTYMSLLKNRFEDSIVFEIPEQSQNPESKVVPLSLQLLLENAVKHNIVTSSKPLHIKIFESNGSLVVENNLQPKQILKKSSGVGLANIRQRYQLLTNRKVIINQKANSFAVALPMLTKQVSVMRQSQLTQSKTHDSYTRARQHVEELKGFYFSLAAYCIVIPSLYFIWHKFTPFTIQLFWFPMFGWGFGLTVQAFRVFVNNGKFGRSWEKRKIEEFMREEEQEKRWN